MEIFRLGGCEDEGNRSFLMVSIIALKFGVFYVTSITLAALLADHEFLPDVTLLQFPIQVCFSSHQCHKCHNWFSQFHCQFQRKGTYGHHDCNVP